MTDAIPAESAGRADGGAGSDSADTAYEWRLRWYMPNEGYRYDYYQTEQAAMRRAARRSTWPGRGEFASTWVARAASVDVQRRRVGPWEDVD